MPDVDEMKKMDLWKLISQIRYPADHHGTQQIILAAQKKLIDESATAIDGAASEIQAFNQESGRLTRALVKLTWLLVIVGGANIILYIIDLVHRIAF